MPALAALLVLVAADPLPDAQRLLDSGDFEAALRRADSALKGDVTPAERAKLHLTRARCFSALRRNADIEAAMEAALVADPEAKLDEADVSPGFRATFDRVRARLAADLTVDTEPQGAAVRIDGALVGRSPLTQLLPVGRYRIGVIDADGVEVTREVVIAARQPQSLTVPLVAPAAPATTAETPVTADADAEKPAPRSVELVVVGRFLTDFRGMSAELGVAVLGRYFIVEAGALAGGGIAIDVRAGGRLPLVGGLLGLQLTVDGVAFVLPSFAPGGGGTASFLIHPLSFLDILIDGSVRFIAAARGFRSQYFLTGITLRARWPTWLDGADPP